MSQTRTHHTANCDAAEIAHILANDRRLAVIDALAEESPQHLSWIADEIAESEVGGTPDTDERKAVYVGLYQTHLPTLAESDVVVYDRRSGEIARGSAFEAYQQARDALADYAGGDA